MAGAIGSRDRLLGVAPGARLLAVRAFSSQASSAEGTTFSILKGIDWAVSQGARIINMSFAGPRDPSLERALKAAYDKGVVLIAAAGNAGPKSPPLYPGADPNVIAVTATDSRRHAVQRRQPRKLPLGGGARRRHPGAGARQHLPDDHRHLGRDRRVSGIVALMLERNPRLTPADIRRILTGERQTTRRRRP